MFESGKVDREEDEAGLITEAVVASFAQADNARLREVCEALTRHLHAAVRETRLSREELDVGLDFINRVGQATTPAHNEAILLADVFGLTTLACHNDEAWEGDETLLGPFWRMHSPLTPNGDTIIRSATPGLSLVVAGRVVDRDGQGIDGVEVDVWQASPCGLYENQDDTQSEMNLRGKFITDAEGRFGFETVMPAGYPVPTHGPVGALLAKQRRHPFRPAHIHFLAWKEGYRTLITQIFVQDDEHLTSDVVFGVSDKLVGTYARSDAGGEAAYRLERTFTMREGEAHLPHPPIA